VDKAHLFDDEYGVLKHLSLKHRMEIGEQDAQMSLTIAERNDDGNSVTSNT